MTPKILRFLFCAYLYQKIFLFRCLSYLADMFSIIFLYSNTYILYAQIIFYLRVIKFLNIL